MMKQNSMQRGGIMQTEKWISINEIADGQKVCAGMIVRLYNVGLNVPNRTEDYYDYLISYVFANDQYLQLVNLSLGEAGNILCILEKELPHYHALGKTLKHMVGVEDTYLLVD